MSADRRLDAAIDRAIAAMEDARARARLMPMDAWQELGDASRELCMERERRDVRPMLERVHEAAQRGRFEGALQ